MKLLPCPFCGGTKLSICETESSWNDPAKAYAVSCASADCHGNIWALGYHLFDTREKAIAAWNTRAEGCVRDQTTTQYCADVVDRDKRIAELKAALQKIADRTKRAHPQAQEGEIHHIAITALTNNTQENING